MKDLLGKAILDFQRGKLKDNPITRTSISEPDIMDIEYLFRTYPKMPAIEQMAVDLSFGKVLDAGCGAGSHSLELQKRGHEVYAIDISANAIEACLSRGVKNASVANIMSITGKFDTVLLLMNGTGICGSLKHLPEFLMHLKSLLTPGGQILIDSSDIIYMFEEEDGSYSIPADGFYGDLIFFLEYEGREEDPFPWLYVPFGLLQDYAESIGFRCKKVTDGAHFDYLAKLTLK